MPQTRAKASATKTRYLFGRWEDSTSLISVSLAGRICKEAEKKQKIFSSYPVDKILRLLDKVRKKWLDKDYHLRKEAEELLLGETGFSLKMIRKGMEQLGVIFDPDSLERKLKTELRGVPKIGEWRYDFLTNTSLGWHPIGTVLHILSGNVFLAGAGSLALGLITGNVNILKLSSGEKVFIPKLIESLIEMDEEGIVSSSITVIDCSSTQKDVILEFKKNVDAVLVWGGEEAVKAYRSDLPAKTKLIIFGPKLSLAVITNDGLKEQGIESVAEKLAFEISVWDQQACTAPQLCYVEEKENAKDLTMELGKYLEKIAKDLPSGEIDFQAACEIRKLRTTHEVAEARGEGLLLESKDSLNWTVVLDKDKTIEPSPLNRTIKVIPYSNINEILFEIESLKGYIQTVGIIVSKKEQSVISTFFAKTGAVRVVNLGEMAGGQIDDPHDGSYDLPQLVNITLNRNSSDGYGYEPFEFASQKEREEIINSRLRRLIDKAMKSEFYGKRLKDLKIETVNDLIKIPFLTREEMENNMPPRGYGLYAGSYNNGAGFSNVANYYNGVNSYYGGYVSRSGGSTGDPKFSIYDEHDWEAMISNAVKIFRVCGIRAGDRLANCFIAGNLYGSFVSFDHINYRVGATSFAFANDVIPDAFLDVWRKFKINAIEGVPTIIVPLLRAVKDLDSSFTIEKVVYAGSPMSKTDYDWIKDKLKAERVSSIIGANDGGQIAYQCCKMEGAFHHTVDDFNYIEIVDENRCGVPDGKPGRILITSLLKFAFPLIRYEIGDEGIIFPDRCKCGRSGRVLKYLGRADDVVSIGILNLSYRDVKEALSEFPVSEMQIVARSSGGREDVVLKVESEIRTNELKTRIYETLLDKVAMLKDRLETGKLYKMEISFYKPGELPRNPRTGKLKNILDERLSG